MINLHDFVGKFLPAEGETCFATLDGSDVATWLTNQGYRVIAHHDTGRNGIVITEDGYRVSTNGYVSR